MNGSVFWGVIIPFMGTSLGACSFFEKRTQRKSKPGAHGICGRGHDGGFFLEPSRTGSGIFTSPRPLGLSASFIGFWIGVFFLLILDHAIPHLHQMSTEPEGPVTKLDKTLLMLLAVTIHNIPEGMAVGVVYAGYASGNSLISLSAALALSLGIAIQNVPEGAIISMPLYERGWSLKKAAFYGILSGIVEPMRFYHLLCHADHSLMPYFLSFAAGAML